MVFTDFIIIAVAAWRLAFFVARESGPFDVMTRVRARTTLGGLLTCVYCASVWTAALMLAFWFTGLQVAVYVAALSGAGLMLAAYSGANHT